MMMNRRWRRVWLMGVLWHAATLSFGGSVLCADASAEKAESEASLESAAKDPREQAYEDIEVLTEALLMIHKHYVDEKSYQEIIYGSLHGMLNNLDPHSSFLGPEAYKALKAGTSGQFGGIGIQVGVRRGLLTVIAPVEDTPAFLAGMMPGDKIIEIDGSRAVGMPLQAALKLLRGAPGTAVVLKIQRSGVENPFELTLERAEIDVPSVRGATMLNKFSGYLRITRFNAITEAQLIEALKALKQQGMASLVLDLRNNPGGLLSAAIEVAQIFLNRGDRIVTMRGRGGEQTDAPRVAGGSFHLPALPVVVLLNAGSASASEIVAGALQDHARAIVVGQTSFGKASVQTVVRMRSNPACAIRLTTARYYTPGGRMIHDVGIEPDINVVMKPAHWRDVQLKRAYKERPGTFPMQDRKEFADITDTQLNRAVDVLTALNLLKKRKEGLSK